MKSMINKVNNQHQQLMDHQKRKEEYSSSSSVSRSINLSTHIKTLETQLTIRTDAVKIAQQLINAYRAQNNSLKSQNYVLKQLFLSQQRNKDLQVKELEIRTLQQKIIQQSERITELLQNNIAYEQHIKKLQRYLNQYQQNLEGQRGNKKNKHRQKTQIIQNYSVTVQNNQHIALKKKLHQKDEQIYNLIRQINMQEQNKASEVNLKYKLDEYKTISTQYESHKKKMNSSLQSLEV